jgi:hypothetical protein
VSVVGGSGFRSMVLCTRFNGRMTIHKMIGESEKGIGNPVEL